MVKKILSFILGSLLLGEASVTWSAKATTTQSDSSYKIEELTSPTAEKRTIQSDAEEPTSSTTKKESADSEIPCDASEPDKTELDANNTENSRNNESEEKGEYCEDEEGEEEDDEELDVFKLTGLGLGAAALTAGLFYAAPYINPKIQAIMRARRQRAQNILMEREAAYRAQANRDRGENIKFVIQALANNQDALAAPVPLRAIAWQHNRCWFYASILYFYHRPTYHNAILNFPTLEAQRILSTLDDGAAPLGTRQLLEAMICLSKVFKILRGTELDPDYRRPQVVYLSDAVEDELIEKLGMVNFIYEFQQRDMGETLSTDHTPQNVCQTVIEHLVDATNLAIQNDANLASLRSWHWQTPNPVNHPEEEGLTETKSLPGHFWVDVASGNTIFHIGERTWLGQNAIHIDNDVVEVPLRNLVILEPEPGPEPEPEPEPEEPDSPFTTVDASYFDDALFIGDSHTCGYGTEGLSAEEQFTPQTENCDLAWGCIVARYFGAEYTLIAHSGQGIVRNWGDEKEVSDCTMRERMRRTLDMEESPAWDGSAYRPDIVVIKLGSNDFSTGIAPAEKPFNDSYARAIDYLRSIWGQVPILCVAPSDNTIVLRYLEQLIAERQDANLHFTAILPGVTNWDSDMGANYHPNHHGHRKLAMSVIPYIATITGWELPDTSVE